MQVLRNAGVFAVTFVLYAILAVGCDQGPQRAPGFEEDSYTSEILLKDNSSIKFNGKVKIEIDKEGVPEIYCFAEQSNSSTTYPNVRVSGVSSFQVHGCGRVTVADGASVKAYGCALVRARENTSVAAYNCELVEKYGELKSLESHGSTKVRTFPAPGSPVPAAAPVNSAPAAAPAAAPAPSQAPAPQPPAEKPQGQTKSESY